jgi:hypothetical protein
MTIAEVLSKVDRLKPNQVAEADKIGWLSDSDMSIFKTIIQAHEGAEDAPAFSGYGEEADRGTVLLAEPPFDRLYLYYLYMQIDYVNAELQKYNNDALLYAAAMADYAAHINRTRLPVHPATRFKL